MASRFEADRDGIARLAGTPEMLAVVMGHAEGIKDKVEQLAPSRKSATYIRGLSLSKGIVDGVATARVNGDKHAVVVEFGRRPAPGREGSPAFRPMGRALDASREG